MTRRNYTPAQRRELPTLDGPVQYADSDWTPSQWAVIRDAMSRCTRPGIPLAQRGHHSRRAKRNETRQRSRAALVVSVQRDIARAQLKLDLRTEQQQLKEEAALRRAARQATNA